MTQETAQPQQPIQPQYKFDEDTISLMDILLVLAKHLKLIIIIPTVFCIITIINVLFFISPLYVSTTSFMSSALESKQHQLLGLASNFGYSLASESVQWSYIDVIKSRTLARNILNHKFNTEKYGFQKTLLQILTYGDEEPRVEIDTLMIGGIKAVQGMIELNKSGRMYELAVSAFEPQLAADIASTVLDELDIFQRGYNSRKVNKTRRFIEDRLLDTKIELEATEEALKDFRERNRSIIGSPQLQLEQDRLSRDVSVHIGVYTTLKQQLETAKIDEVKELNYVAILDEPVIPLFPSKPRKKFMVVLAGILGIGLGIVLAFIREYTMRGNLEEQEKLKKAKSLFVKNITNF